MVNDDIEYTEEANIKIWHVDDYQAFNSEINQAIRLSNDLVRSANNSYFY